MALKALLEILVHLDKFRNIDLFFQGVYYLKLRLLCGRQPMHPYWNFTTSRQDQKDKYMPPGTDPHNVFRPVTPDDESYVSKGVMIRYSEEEAEINEVCMFRCELDIEPGFQQTEILMEVSMFFSDVQELGGTSQWKSNWKRYSEQGKFNVVQTVSYRLTNAA